ncbi:FR47-like protein [Pseudobutyrivibrio sp. ACV-2]|uniref:GNAT family N-acetyltransferase n=1 Tax=Pseudobutyrivibrio sp. ACV-2 TaxID=1520801 RepID=UPI0008981BBC|nr:GNAT family N-acetyltransferase [Pseudobutyrivibrio sp. ACV-2]SEB07244.1 FR47-like protein [Pseudobutyrivibrio sp. ACV-2]
METLKIISELFNCNGWISDCCSGYGDNISPDIIIDGLPEGTISLAVLMDDFPFISPEYDLITEDELKEVIEYKNIVLGYTDEGIVGFIGEHLEGSIGLLYILPEYRRRGYASELEKEMFRRTREKGYIPFGQVVTTNDASIKLQESMGLTKSEGTVLWMWR